MAFGHPVAKLVLQTYLHGQEMFNVFHYAMTQPPANLNQAVPLVDGFIADVVPDIKAVMSQEVSFGTVEAYFYENPAQYDIQDAGGNGNSNNEAATSIVTLGFKYRGNYPGQRPGFKRFSGVPETNVQGYVITPATYVLVVDALAARLESGILNDGAFYIPVVATGSKVLGVNPDAFTPQGVAYNGVGSQVSRKP